jgi:pre-rRNA-processing protein TSR1
MSKFDRRNRAKQMRLNKDSEHAKATNVFAGKDGAPRIIALIPLCADISTAAAARSLNASLDIDEVQAEDTILGGQEGTFGMPGCLSYC